MTPPFPVSGFAQGAAAPAPLDVSALRSRLRPGALRRFHASQRVPWRDHLLVRIVSAAVAVVGALAVAVVTVVVLAPQFLPGAAEGGRPSAIAEAVASAGLPSWAPVWLPALLPAIPLVVVLVLLVRAVRWGVALVRETLRRVRVAEFAADNRFGFRSRSDAGGYTGVAFEQPGYERHAAAVLSSVWGSLPFRIGGFRVEAIEQRRIGYRRVLVRSFGFVELTLPSRVPHIVLLNAKARVLAAAGLSFRRDQRLRLEGNFDDTFSLYAPQGYERDALYIFTPDLMQLLLEVAADVEIELTGDRLYLYSSRDPRMWDPDVATQLLAALDVLGAKVHRQTKRYTDDRVLGTVWVGGVHASGRELRRRGGWWASVSGVLGLAVALGMSAFVLHVAGVW